MGHASDDDYLSQAVQGLDDDEAHTVLLGVLRSNPLDQLGQRTPEEVVERLLRKIRRPDSEGDLRLALQSAFDLAQVRGNAETALAGASAALRRAGADTAAVSRLQQVIGMLPQSFAESGNIALDFGLVRGLAYYNGIVFEVSHPGCPSPLGGGRTLRWPVPRLGAETATCPLWDSPTTSMPWLIWNSEVQIEPVMMPAAFSYWPPPRMPVRTR